MMTPWITRRGDRLALRVLSAFLLLVCGVAAAADSDGPPRVLFRENFEDTNFASRGWYDSDAAVVLSSEQHIPGSTKSYEIRFRAGDISPATSRCHLFAESDSVYMIQDSQNITANTTGEDRAVAGCNGDWDGYGSGECYKLDGERRNGKGWQAKQRYFRDSPGPYYKGDWHHIEAYFRLNTISAQGRSNKDGVVQYWYDGTALIDIKDAVLRSAKYPGMKFNQFLVAPHIGDGSPIDQSLWVDDLLVATGKPAAGVNLRFSPPPPSIRISPAGRSEKYGTSL